MVREVEHDCVLASRKRWLVFGRCPSSRDEHDQVVCKYRLALEQIESITAEASPFGHNHSVAAPFGHIELGGNRERFVEDARRIAIRNSRVFTGVGENGLTSDRARS